MTTDPREGLPSASGMHRIKVCPGSWRMEKGLPDQPTDDSVFGDLVHELCETELEGAGHSGEGYSQEVREVAELCIAGRNKMVEEWEGLIGTAVNTHHHERRLWLHGVSASKLMSGQFDYWCADMHHGHVQNVLCVDYKSGRGEVEDVEINTQLRSAAVLIDHYYRGKGHLLKTVSVGIVQPLVAGGTRWVCYDREDLERAYMEILGILDAAKDPDAQLNPDPHACQYCKARSICPALQADAGTLVTTQDTAMRVWHDMKPSAKLDLWDLACKAEIAAKAIKDACKADLEADAEAIPGLVQTEGRRTRKVTDLQAVWENVGDILSVSDFVGCCDVSLPKLEKAIKDAEGITAKEAAAELEVRCGRYIEQGRTAPIVKRVRMLEVGVE